MEQKWVLHLIHHSQILLVHAFNRLLVQAARSAAHWEVDCLEGKGA